MEYRENFEGLCRILEKKNKKLLHKNNELVEQISYRNREVDELKCHLKDVQATNDAMREDIEKEVAAECGCIVIDGAGLSAAYQDLVGILLSNGYGVELTPIDQNRRLKVIIKEREV